jgi:hypothetical protein
MSENSSKKQAPLGRGDLLLSLPDPLQTKILGRVPILELRRLLKSDISPDFSAAIRTFLEEIILECLRAVPESKRTVNMDTAAFKGASKAEYLSTDVYAGRVDGATGLLLEGRTSLRSFARAALCFVDLQGRGAQHLDRGGQEAPARGR